MEPLLTPIEREALAAEAEHWQRWAAEFGLRMRLLVDRWKGQS